MSTPDNTENPSSYTYPPPPTQRNVAAGRATETQSYFEKIHTNLPVDQEAQERKNFEQLQKELPGFFGHVGGGRFSGGIVERIDSTGWSTIHHYPETRPSRSETHERFVPKSCHAPPEIGAQVDYASSPFYTSRKPPPSTVLPERPASPVPHVREYPPSRIHNKPPAPTTFSERSSPVQPWPASRVRAQDFFPASSSVSYSSTGRSTTVIINGGTKPEGNEGRDAMALAQEFFGNTDGWTVVNGGEFTSFGDGRRVVNVKPGDIVRKD